MAQEQYFKAVPVSKPPKKDGYFMLAREMHSGLTNEPYTDTYYAYFLEAIGLKTKKKHADMKTMMLLM